MFKRMYRWIFPGIDRHHQDVLLALFRRLRMSNNRLSRAVTGQSHPQFAGRNPTGVGRMNPILQQLAEEVNRTVEVQASTVTLINGFAARLDAAVAAAIAGGATPEMLASVTAEIEAMKTSREALAAAVAANTPGN